MYRKRNEFWRYWIFLYNTLNKFENSGLSAIKSEIVDAPIINEFPICFECEFIEYQDDEYGPFRYNELKRFLDPISFKTLTSNLKDLENNCLIIRKEYQEIPPKVE